MHSNSKIFPSIALVLYCTMKEFYFLPLPCHCHLSCLARSLPHLWHFFPLLRWRNLWTAPNRYDNITYQVPLSICDKTTNIPTIRLFELKVKLKIYVNSSLWHQIKNIPLLFLWIIWIQEKQRFCKWQNIHYIIFFIQIRIW